MGEQTRPDAGDDVGGERDQQGDRRVTDQTCVGLHARVVACAVHEPAANPQTYQSEQQYARENEDELHSDSCYPRAKGLGPRGATSRPGSV